MAVKKFVNEYLDHIKLEQVVTINKFDDIKELCSYFLYIGFTQEQAIWYQYYNRKQRNKDFQYLQSLIKGEKHDNQ